MHRKRDDAFSVARRIGVNRECILICFIRECARARTETCLTYFITEMSMRDTVARTFRLLLSDSHYGKCESLSIL